MSLIRIGNPLRARPWLLAALLSALLGLALFGPASVLAQDVNEIRLTDKQIEGFIAAQDEMAKLYDGSNLDNSDPKIEAEAEAVVKKHGFAGLIEYDDVSINISIIMAGIDPQTRRFTEAPDQIKKDIAALRADKSVPDAQKKEDLARLEQALKEAKPVQFKENIALVLKYFDKLPPLQLQEPTD